MAQGFNIIRKKAIKPFAQYAWRVLFTGVSEDLKNEIKEPMLERLNYCVTKIDLPKLSIDASKNKFEYGNTTLMLPSYNPSDMQIKMTFEETDDMLVTSFLSILAGETPWLNSHRTHTVTFSLTINNGYSNGEVLTTRIFNGHLMSYTPGRFNRNSGSVNAVEIEVVWSITAVDATGIVGSRIGADALHTQISKADSDAYQASRVPVSPQASASLPSIGDGNQPVPSDGSTISKQNGFPVGKSSDTKNTDATALEKRKLIAPQLFPGDPKAQQDYIKGRFSNAKKQNVPLGADGSTILNRMNKWADLNPGKYPRTITGAGRVLVDMGLIYNEGQCQCAKSVSLMVCFAKGRDAGYVAYGNGNQWGDDRMVKKIAEFSDGEAYHAWVAANPTLEYVVSISYNAGGKVLNQFGHAVVHTSDGKFLSNSSVESENTYKGACNWKIYEPPKA